MPQRARLSTLPAQAEEMEKRRSMRTYAQAGTGGLFVTARSKETLASVAEKAQKLAPTVAIKIYAVDVTDAKAAGESVKQCAESRNRERWLRRKRVKIGDADPEEWWMSMIVNIRGTFNNIHHTIKHLVAATGHAILVSSIGAQLRLPGASSSQTAKHALNRLAEFVQLSRQANFLRAPQMAPP